MVMKKISRYRLMRMRKISAREGCELVGNEVYAFCYICGKKDKLENFTIDHFVAHFNGGTDCLKNLRICCTECNRKKAETERPTLPHSRI
ncbi:MAG: HNH endonuclease [Elusimicrobia bacterium]|nr:HNH endonuclease [Elusimicrobiota bacterium]